MSASLYAALDEARSLIERGEDPGPCRNPWIAKILSATAQQITALYAAAGLPAPDVPVQPRGHAEAAPARLYTALVRARTAQTAADLGKQLGVPAVQVAVNVARLRQRGVPIVCQRNKNVYTYQLEGGC
jgi:biotin operon repressor